jgi:hypothetical protein
MTLDRTAATMVFYAIVAFDTILAFVIPTVALLMSLPVA